MCPLSIIKKMFSSNKLGKHFNCVFERSRQIWLKFPHLLVSEEERKLKTQKCFDRTHIKHNDANRSELTFVSVLSCVINPSLPCLLSLGVLCGGLTAVKLGCHNGYGVVRWSAPWVSLNHRAEKKGKRSRVVAEMKPSKIYVVFFKLFVLNIY